MINHVSVFNTPPLCRDLYALQALLIQNSKSTKSFNANNSHSQGKYFNENSQFNKSQVSTHQRIIIVNSICSIHSTHQKTTPCWRTRNSIVTTNNIHSSLLKRNAANFTLFYVHACELDNAQLTKNITNKISKIIIGAKILSAIIAISK